MNTHIKAKRFLYIAGVVLLFIFLGTLKGFFPFLNKSSIVEGAVVGNAPMLFHGGDGIQHVYNALFPYGCNLTEGFGMCWLIELFLLAGIDSLTATQLGYAVLYVISFFSLKTLLEKITENKVAILAVMILFFLDPFLTAQEGIPFMLWGILFFPAVMLSEYSVYLRIRENEPIQPKNWKIFLGSFLVKLFATSLGWYAAVISACTTSLFLLMYVVLTAIEDERKSRRKDEKKFRCMAANYVVFGLLPWVFAMLAILSLTPVSTAVTVSPIEFYAGNAVDVATLFVPDTAQAISEVFSFSDLLEGCWLTGDGTMHSNYLGYALLGGFLYVCFSKRVRNKEMIALGLTFLTGLILSFGPGLKVLVTTTETGYYRYLCELDKTIVFPWSKLFPNVFPLSSMRAVYRWLMMAKATLLISFVFCVNKLMTMGKKGKIVAGVLMSLALIEFIPSRRSLELNKYNYNVLQGLQKELIHECDMASEQLRITGDETGMYMTYDLEANAFLVSWMSSELNIKSYTGGGDKNLAVGQRFMPQNINTVQRETNPENIAKLITHIKESGNCDFIVFPYFCMRTQSSVWPAADAVSGKTKAITVQVRDILDNMDFEYLVHEYEHFAIFDLREAKETETIREDRIVLDSDNVYSAAIDVAADEMLYVYALLEFPHKVSGSNQIAIEVFDSNENLVADWTDEIGAESNYYRLEQELTLPGNVDEVRAEISYNGSEKVTAKGVVISGIDNDALYKSREEQALEEFGIDNVWQWKNVALDGECMSFSNDGIVEFSSDTGKPFEKFEVSMKIFIEEQVDPNNVSIFAKWNYWCNEMSFVIGMKEEKSFVAITPDGVTPYSIWFDNTLLEHNAWHELRYIFSNGIGAVYIDDEMISAQDYPFEAMYNSDETNFMLGTQFSGKISDFVYRYEGKTGERGNEKAIK